MSSAKTKAEEVRLEPEEKDDNDEIEIVTEVIEEESGQVGLNNSTRSEADPAGPSLVDSSDAAFKCSTIDLITRNADFVSFS